MLALELLVRLAGCLEHGEGEALPPSAIPDDDQLTRLLFVSIKTA